MRLALAPAEEGDPEGKEAGGEDPMREAEAGVVIERRLGRRSRSFSLEYLDLKL